jgi:hypothetical protein
VWLAAVSAASIGVALCGFPIGTTSTAAPYVGSVSGIPHLAPSGGFPVWSRPADPGSGPSATVTLAHGVPPWLVPTDQSWNWSGYALTGGPFTSVRGTFTVPSLLRYDPGSTMSEWVGLDGFADHSLVQAGVNEVPESPSTFLVQPWWQVLPSLETPITDLAVRPGDRVTVLIIGRAPGEWKISLADDTTGASFVTDQFRAIRASSAEWIVEALTVNGRLTPLAPYAPAVSFSGLHSTGPTHGVWRLVLQRVGPAVAIPSLLSIPGFAVVSARGGSDDRCGPLPGCRPSS